MSKNNLDEKEKLANQSFIDDKLADAWEFKKLEDKDFVKAIDQSAMATGLANFALQCRDAWRLGCDIELPAQPPRGFKNVLLVGMGASAVGADLTKQYAKSRAKIPVEVWKSYDIPAWVGKETLVIAISHSGNTTETVTAYLQAVEAGAITVALTGGGKLAAYAHGNNLPMILIPQTLPSRNSMGYLTLPILLILKTYGLLDVAQQELYDILQVVNDLAPQAIPEIPLSVNPAKQLAARLYGRLPVIWGVADSTAVMAYRFKSQLNENAKTPAYCNIFPELDHNEVAGVSTMPKIQDSMAVVILRSFADSLPMQNRVDITKKLWQSKVGDIVEVWAKGKTALSKLFYLILLGDYTSFYLACLYNQDPADTLLIADLNAKLAEKATEAD